MKNEQPSSECGDGVALSELKAIKQLLALLLLRHGAGQQQVAKAAGVAKLAINRLANVGVGKRKTRTRKE